MQTRPPIVVILGHVDHGKTTLLDTIRSADVASKEYGGITQGIGAYQSNGVTFIDTPGHEAFSKMRSRGTNVADIAILVVATNDSVMPQTEESIKIIKNAKIPYIVAINKVDLPEANFDKVVKDLLRHEVMLETYGGDVPFIKISAKKKDGIKELLDLIKLVADMLNIKNDPAGPLEFSVIESRLDKNRGAVATLIIRNGTLKVGQEITIDGITSKIRALIDYLGKNVSEAGPGNPVEVLGLEKVPSVGAAQVETKPVQVKAEDGALNLVLKADTIGSLEAVSAQIPQNVNLLQSSTGEVTEADVLLAKSTKGIILSFNAKIAPSALKLAQTEKVLVRTYKIIYELLDELKDAASGMLTPIESEEILGTGKIIAEFPFEKLRVAGVKVTDGRLARGDLIKIGEQRSKIKSIRHGKEETNKVEAGKECGVLLDPQIDFRAEDDIMAYRVS